MKLQWLTSITRSMGLKFFLKTGTDSFVNHFEIHYEVINLYDFVFYDDASEPGKKF